MALRHYVDPIEAALYQEVNWKPSGTLVTQNPAQQVPAEIHTESQPSPEMEEPQGVLTIPCGSMQYSEQEFIGVEGSRTPDLCSAIESVFDAKNAKNKAFLRIFDRNGIDGLNRRTLRKHRQNVV